MTLCIMIISDESELIMESIPLTGGHRQTCCRPVCRMSWLKNKGTMLVALWNFLVTPVYYLLKDGHIGTKHKLEDTLGVSINGMVLLSATLLYPIGGWLADAHFGRYKVVRCSMWIMWIGTIITTLGEVLARYSEVYNDHAKVWLYLVLCVVILTGFGGFSSNIVQLGIDQLMNASASEISSFILWYVLAIYTSALCLHFLSDCLLTEYNVTSVRGLIAALCLTLALCLDFFCKHWLVSEEVRGKSLSEVWIIIKYTIKNRKLRYRLALDDNKDLTSPLDIAKHQYGGPFTSLQVENVRTFLKMIAIFATCGLVFGAIIPMEYAREKIQHRWDGYNQASGYIVGCYKQLTLHYEDYIFTFVLVSLYEFLVRPVFYQCLPRGSIASRFIVSTVLFLMWILSLLAIESYAYSKLHSSTNNNSLTAITCIFNEDSPVVKLNQTWFLMPNFFNGASRILLFVTEVEFICAQTPSTMKGLMFGIAYAILGLNTLLQSVIALPFLFKFSTLDWNPLTCGIWYLIMEGALILAVLIAVTILVKMVQPKK